MIESWTYINNFEFMYEISNLGNIRSVNRNVIDKNGISTFRKGLNISKKYNGNYFQVDLYKNSKKYRYYVHRLVYEHFGDKEFNKSFDVNHIDGDKLNNCIDNLELVSHKDNFDHAIKNNMIKRNSLGQFKI